MNQTDIPATPPIEGKLLLLYLSKKLTITASRWGLYVFTGLLSWLLIDALPPFFFWCTLVMMMGAMSLHSVLHRKPGASEMVKYWCRFAFFLSFPMLFIFAGNRMAKWSVSDAVSSASSGISSAQGAIPSEAYLLLKELHKEKFKDPVKTKNGFKKILGKQLAKLKAMDDTTRILLIILGIVLLIVILFLIAVIVSINESTETCLGNDSNDDGCL